MIEEYSAEAPVGRRCVVPGGNVDVVSAVIYLFKDICPLEENISVTDVLSGNWSGKSDDGTIRLKLSGFYKPLHPGSYLNSAKVILECNSEVKESDLEIVRGALVLSGLEKIEA